MARRYSLLSYGTMMTCAPRVDAFAEALRRAVTPGCRVFDIGAGPGLFSLLACQFGAGEVVAIEPSASTDLLLAFARANGYTDRIRVVRGLSTDYVPEARADVIVSDLRGAQSVFERHLPSVIDARERLLAPGGTLIAMRDTLRVALAYASGYGAYFDAPWATDRHGLDLSEIGRAHV